MRLRLSMDNYLWKLAFQVAERSTCDRFKAGCVVAKDGVIVATGYNGSVDGEPHCDEAGHELIHVMNFSANSEDNIITHGDTIVAHCIRTIHAEINCIINAAKVGQSLEGCDWYLNGVPCKPCSMAIARLYPHRIFFPSDIYPAEGIIEWWQNRLGRGPFVTPREIITKPSNSLKEIGVME
ncbi:hypothetical protein LCGC14_0235270 [marine sediment metagenome]|uniref:CMP/dCMP-type deaminase domain-containing protein n=1 Tax=marine sediment metagenome TaxID=412755 RepID=A0A0F9WTP2_9ZZZZ